jgi:hypothetical protein
LNRRRLTARQKDALTKNNYLKASVDAGFFVALIN